jgi:hypothetical protein
MLRSPKEYSIEELLEHPVLGVQMTSEGIERRSVDLMVDAVSSHHRFSLGGFGEGLDCSFVP